MAKLSVVLILMALIVEPSFVESKGDTTGKFRGQPPGPSSEDGAETEVTVSIDEDGAEEKVKVKKMKSGKGSLFEAPAGSSFSVGKSENVSLACFTNENPVHGTCQKACLAKVKDQTCFTCGEKSLCFDKSDPNMGFDTVIPPPLEEEEQPNTKTTHRRRREVAPDLSQTGFINVLYFLDGELMNTFLTFADWNVNATVHDVEMFLLLSTNEMTLCYQSLKGRSQITIEGQTRPLDMAVYMAGIIWPDFDDYTYTYQDPGWSVPDGNGVLTGDPLEDFRYYLWSFSTGIVFDQATAVTGYNLPGFVGQAFVGTVCKESFSNLGYNSAIARPHAGIDRIVAHELGHGLGMWHDESPCENNKYIMAPSILPVYYATQDTYDIFSNCSVNYITSHLNGLGADYVSGCLYGQITDEQFLINYCQGTYQTLTLDEQCQLSHDRNGTSCNSNWYLNSTHVTRCDFYGLKCTDSGGLCGQHLYEVRDGTPCVLSGDSTERVCYNGECLPVQTMCGTEPTSSTTSTTTSPTTTSTTTTTTQPPPTTTPTTTTSTTTTQPPPTTTPTTTTSTTTTQPPPTTTPTTTTSTTTTTTQPPPTTTPTTTTSTTTTQPPPTTTPTTTTSTTTTQPPPTTTPTTTTSTTTTQPPPTTTPTTTTSTTTTQPPPTTTPTTTTSTTTQPPPTTTPTTTTTTTTQPPPTTTPTTTTSTTTTTTTQPPPTTTPTTTTTTTSQPGPSCPSTCTSTTDCGVFATATACRVCCCCSWQRRRNECLLKNNFSKCN